MVYTKTLRFIILNPDEPESDLVFYIEDWARIKSLLQDQPLSPDFLEVEYTLEFSNRGRLRYLELTKISDNKYKEKYSSEEMFAKLSGKAKETRWIMTRAIDIAPDDIKVTVDVSYKFYTAKIYVNSDLALEFYDRSSYRLVKLYDTIIPKTLMKKIEEYLLKKGFKRGEYGGIISKVKMNENEKKQLIEDLKNIIENYRQEILKKIREEKVRARNILLWVDNWDPDKLLEDDVREKLEGKKEEAEEEAIEAIVDEAVETEEIGKKILEETEKVEVELETTVEPTAVVKEEEKPRRQELVKIYLLKMRLPSKYLVQQVKVEKDGEGYREIRDFSDKRVYTVASRLEGVRRTVYEKISNYFFFFDPYGVWIAVSEEAVRKADEISEWLRKELESLKELIELKGERIVDRYIISAIPVYFEPKHAREILEESINMLQSEIETLEEKIREAENAKKRSILRKLEKKLKYKQALLESFRKYLEQLG